MGKLGIPNIDACFAPAFKKPAVQSVAVAMPFISSSTMSCTLHDTQEPQSPMAVMTALQSASCAMTAGSQNLV